MVSYLDFHQQDKIRKQFIIKNKKNMQKQNNNRQI